MLKYGTKSAGKIIYLEPRDEYERLLKGKGYRIIKREVRDNKAYLIFRKGRSVITTFDGKDESNA